MSGEGFPYRGVRWGHSVGETPASGCRKRPEERDAATP